jgi:anionic cell wall polymer biosynthesis LytR-Cps2A-Psr (LCP) family protein/uncharacterized protein YraI
LTRNQKANRKHSVRHITTVTDFIAAMKHVSHIRPLIAAILTTCIVASFATPTAHAGTPAAKDIAAPPRQDPAPIPGQARLIQFPPGTVNIALLGIDKRPSKAFNNTDVIIIASINTEIPAVTLLSIPRDTPAYIPGVGVYKINTAFAAGGPDLFKQTIRYNYGIEIANYALVNFTGLVHAVDTFGGVDVIATCPLQHAFPRDPYYMGDVYVVRSAWTDTFTGEVWPIGSKVPRTEINIPKPGVYALDGLQALAFVRARYGVPGGDVDRGRREQRVVRALLAKAKQVGSLTKLTELYSKLKDDVETDMTLETVLRFATMIDKLGDTLIRSRYLVGYDANGAALEGAPEPGLTRQQYVEKALTVALNQRANNGIPVTVLNGTNDAGFVAAAADRLKELGFVVTAVEPADKPYAKSVVLDHTTTKKGSALPVLQRTFDIKAANIIDKPSPDGPRFTVVVGADFNTCYYARTLHGSGSEQIEANASPALNSAKLPATIALTSSPVAGNPMTSGSVAMTATQLLANTASSRLAPVLSNDSVKSTMSVAQGDIVNVRTGPGVQFRAITRLTGGQSAQILGRSLDGDWLNIELPDARRPGWVKAEVVTIINNTAAPRAHASAAAEVTAQITVPRGDVVNLRTGPGLGFEVIGQLYQLQSADIIGRSADGDWWQVTSSGGQAWVSAGFVSVKGDASAVPVVR